jgi:hypothetical protein
MFSLHERPCFEVLELGEGLLSPVHSLSARLHDAHVQVFRDMVRAMLVTINSAKLQVDMQVVHLTELEHVHHLGDPLLSRYGAHRVLLPLPDLAAVLSQHVSLAGNEVGQAVIVPTRTGPRDYAQDEGRGVVLGALEANVGAAGPFFPLADLGAKVKARRVCVCCNHLTCRDCF